MPKRIVDKLVRDNIVDHLKEQGKTVKFRHLEKDDEKKQKLIEKFGEKYKEMFEALIHNEQSTDKITDNIADMLEVMNKIAHLRNIDLAYVMERKKQKVTDKGGYEKRVYIEHVEE